MKDAHLDEKDVSVENAVASSKNNAGTSELVCVNKFANINKIYIFLSETVKVLPEPNSLFTVIEPSCVSINSLLIASPSPVPSFFVPGTL